MGDLIYIVDDDDEFRSAIAKLLGLHGYEVAQYGSANLFLKGLQSGAAPACILLDFKLPGLSGPELQQRLLELGATFPVIFLTGYGDVPTVVKTIKAGAEDVLTKPVSEQTLVEAINRAVANSQKLRAKHEWRQEAQTLLNSLTPREREVFERVVRGKANKQTARDLGISERTVKAHRHRIFEKMQARTLADLVSLAERLDILSEQENETPPTGNVQTAQHTTRQAMRRADADARKRDCTPGQGRPSNRTC